MGGDDAWGGGVVVGEDLHTDTYRNCEYEIERERGRERGVLHERYIEREKKTFREWKG